MMTEQEKQQIIDELEKRIEKKYKGCLTREDTQSVLKEPREKWFTYDSIRKPDSPMHKAFGNIIYWQVWELIRKLTCIICGCQYVRHLAGNRYADEVADRLCQFIYELKTEYNEKARNAWRDDNDP